MCWTQTCIWRRWTHMNCCIASLFIRNTFEGILKSQLIRFLTICNNMEDFYEATSILFKVLCEKLRYPGRFLRQIKAKFLRNHQLLGITYDPIGDASKCKSRRYQCCLYMDRKITFQWWWLWFSHICWIKFLFEKYVGEVGHCSKDSMYNHIRYQWKWRWSSFQAF